MSLQRAVHCVLCSGFGILLFAETAIGAEAAEINLLQTTDECGAADICIDQYLWSLYDRTPKVDSARIAEKKKVRIKRKGKSTVVTRTIIKLADEDFAWKDPAAAQKRGMSLKEYVIGGMDHGFKLTLYRALRALDDAGLVPGITSAFRYDYRQSITTGFKARTDCSYHGGSRHGGYGHGLAIDVVSVKGKTRSERWASSEELWDWIDTHGKAFGIGRPYLGRDPPHIAPIDGKEYLAHRGRAKTMHAESKPRKQRRLAAHNVAKRAVIEGPRIVVAGGGAFMPGSIRENTPPALRH